MYQLWRKSTNLPWKSTQHHRWIPTTAPIRDAKLIKGYKQPLKWQRKKKFYRSLLRCPWRWSTRLHSGRWTWISWDRAGSSYAPFNFCDKLARAISCGNIIGRSDWTGCQSRAWLRFPCWAADDVLERILELNYLFFCKFGNNDCLIFYKVCRAAQFLFEKKKYITNWIEIHVMARGL